MAGVCAGVTALRSGKFSTTSIQSRMIEMG
jgi:hypothetical protein